LANTASQEKRIRQNEKQRSANSRVKSAIRTANKKVIKLTDSKDEKDIALIQKNYVEFVKLIDTASRKGIIHKNTTARKKSRLAKKINKLQS
jgi:small subunit ribosomal protein S20